MIEIPFPKSVLNVTLTPSQGKYSFDPVTKVMTWDVGKIDVTKLPNIRGSVSVGFTALRALFVLKLLQVASVRCWLFKVNADVWMQTRLVGSGLPSVASTLL